MPLGRFQAALPSRLLGRVYLVAGVSLFDLLIRYCVPHRDDWLIDFLPAFVVACAFFVSGARTYLKRQTAALVFRTPLLVLHFACVATYIIGFRPETLDALPPWGDVPAALLLYAILVAGFVCLCVACAPAHAWAGLLREELALLICAMLVGLVAQLPKPVDFIWNAPTNLQGRFLQTMTFRGVHAVLIRFLPGIRVDAETFSIYAPHFGVTIESPCSGMAGLVLVLAFTLGWIWFFRKELRIPRALLLVAVALGCIWTLNILRLCALVLIGSTISPGVALHGFHSNAGWAAFTTVALAFAAASQKLSWVQKTTGGLPSLDRNLSLSTIEAPELRKNESRVVAAYLVPFLAILAASFVSKGASNSFEYLYPLRFVAGAAALWHFRAQWKNLNWRFGWTAVAAGGAVFLMWIAPSVWWHRGVETPLGSELANLSPPLRLTWIFFRAAAAIFTVPLAEELAFRGYLARRVLDRSFDQVPFRRLTISSVVISSLCFGLMHGSRWIAGTLAGLAFALLLRRKGRMGDAVTAHAVANLLLTVWVLVTGDFAQW